MARVGWKLADAPAPMTLRLSKTTPSSLRFPEGDLSALRRVYQKIAINNSRELLTRP